MVGFFFWQELNCTLIRQFGGNFSFASPYWLRSTMDSMRVSGARDPGSIPGEATLFYSDRLVLERIRCLRKFQYSLAQHPIHA